MKSLRRSINKEPPAVSAPLNAYPAPSRPNAQAQSKSTTKAIRCIQPYRSKNPQELSCAVGDCLHVVRDMQMGWYEVINPMNNSRGVVPKSCFEEMPKSNSNSIQAGPTARVPPPQMNPRAQSMAGKLQTRHQTFYAIVQYDFSAERPDELDAKAGEPISVVAQSNREWFVAKPIGRLGGPGLIPVSFVEIRDPATNLPVKDVEGLMEKGVLPRVEEWKQATAEYKASSIPLGVLDTTTNGSVVADSPFMKQNQQRQRQPHQSPQQQAATRQSQQHARSLSYATSQSHAASSSHSHAVSTTSIPPAPPSKPQKEPPGPPASDVANPDLLPPGTVLSASIPSFHYENDEYWFRIDAMYQAISATASAPRVLQLILYRNYDDFYEFQISLLNAFPAEAGRDRQSQVLNGDETPPVSDESSRVLPYMPGPVSYVDDMITSVRRTELDQYLGELCALENKGNGYILRHDLVRLFLSPKSGDVVDEVEVNDDWVLGTKYANADADARVNEPIEETEQEQSPRRSYVDDVAQDMSRMRIPPSSSSADGAARSSIGGNGYEEERTPQGRYSAAGGRSTPDESVGRRSASRSRSPINNPSLRGPEEERDNGSRPNSQFNQQPLTPYSAASDYSSSSQAQGGHSHSRSYSNAATLSPPSAPGPSYSGYGSGSASTQSRSARSSGYTQDGAAGVHPYGNGSHINAPSGPLPPIPPQQQQAASRSSHYQSEGGHQSDAGGGTRTSTSNPPSAPPFLKIKIFHSESDDLIAIRVPPRVNFNQLINKVRDRLGPGVSVLRYRDSYDGGGAGGSAAKNWREIVGDSDLRDWISKGDKLVLYAD